MAQYLFDQTVLDIQVKQEKIQRDLIGLICNLILPEQPTDDVVDMEFSESGTFTI